MKPGSTAYFATLAWRLPAMFLAFLHFLKLDATFAKMDRSVDLCLDGENLISVYSFIQVITIYVVTRRLKGEIVEPEKTSTARQRLGRNVPAAMNT
jgi:hypothetical protein